MLARILCRLRICKICYEKKHHKNPLLAHNKRFINYSSNLSIFLYKGKYIGKNCKQLSGSVKDVKQQM